MRAEELPPDRDVVGLSYIETSSHIKGLPFIQTFAYAQARKGGRLNFSFAEHMTGVVVAKPGMPNPWTQSLEFFPGQVLLEDFRHFDYALVNARQQRHANLSTIPCLKPVTTSQNWRLYKVDHPALEEILALPQDPP